MCSFQVYSKVIVIHVSILFQILSPLRLLHTIEQSSCAYTVDPCWLFFFFLAAAHDMWTFPDQGSCAPYIKSVES